MNKYVDKDGLQYFAEELTAKNKEIFAVKAEVGTPLVAATAAAMTDTSKIYVYTGSETGYTAGDWYYYDGSAWQSGGVYNSAAVQTDTTLSVTGMAADAKTVGDAIAEVEAGLIEIDDTLSVSGEAADAAAVGAALEEISETTRNLFNINGLPEKTGITNSNGVLSGTAGAFNTAFGASTVGISSGITFKADTQYTITFDAKTDGGATGNGLAFVITYSDNTVGYIVCAMSETDYTHHKVISEANKTVSKIGIGYFANPTTNWYVKNIQIEKNSNETAYIPYVTATDYIAREEAAKAQTDLATTNTNIAARTAYVNSQLSLMNSVNLFSKTYSGSSDGVTCVSTGDGHVTINGSHTSDVYFDIGSLSDLDVALGSDYWLFYESPSALISYIAIYFNTGDGYALAYNNLVGLNKISIPVGATGMILRLYVKANNTFSNTKYRLTISAEKSNHDLTPKSAQIRYLGAWGTGDCTMIKFDDGTVLVVDFGFDEIQETLKRNWGRAVSDLGVTHIDYAVISHYHSDHIGMLLDGIDDLIDSNTTFFLPNLHAYTTAELETLAWVDAQSGDTVVSNYTAVMTELTDNGCRIVYPTEDSIFSVGGCELQFFNANQAWIMDKFADHETYDYNEASMCCYVKIGSQRILFGGDIGTQAMTKFEKTVLQSQIFKANHHAVGYTIVPLFLNSVMPQMVVTMLGSALSQSSLPTSDLQGWCEDNCVPNVVTGVMANANLSLFVNEGGFMWNTACRRLICEDEWPTT